MIFLAILLALGDLATTLVGVRRRGVGAEANPVAARLMRRLGQVGFSLAYLGGAGLLIALAARFEGALAGLCAILALVLANNLLSLWRGAR